MIGVILAAGLGSRLRPFTADLPKAMVELGGRPLLERSLENLHRAGIDRVIVVHGHAGRRIEEYFGTRFRGIQLVYRTNPEYATTGSMHSLLCARDAIGADPILLLESDLLYPDAALTTLLQSPHPDAILVAPLLDNGDDVRITTDVDGRIVDLGKQIPRDHPGVAGCLVGISRFGPEFLREMLDIAAADHAAGRATEHYEETVLRTSFATGRSVHAAPSGPIAWTEIDNQADFQYAVREVLPRISPPAVPPVPRKILLNPGPATTSDRVKYAQVVPDICPRESEFGDLLESISRDISRIAVPEGSDVDLETVIFGGSGTAAVEAALTSVVPAGGRVAILDNGAYGSRMVQIARAFGIDHLRIESPSDQAPDLDRIRAALGENPGITTLAAVHHETTSGLLNPIRELGAIASEVGATFVVDAMSSFAGLPIDMAEDGIHFMTASSNKCLQGMAGASFVVCRADSLKALRDHPRRGFYLSLYDQFTYMRDNHQTRFTPPVQTLYSLRAAIDELLEEGLEGRFARYRRNGQILRDGVTELGLEIITRPEDESGLLFAVRYPSADFHFDAVHDALYHRGYTIYPGKIGDAATFRLASMGDLTEHDIRGFLAALAEVLAN